MPLIYGKVDQDILLTPLVNNYHLKQERILNLREKVILLRMEFYNGNPMKPVAKNFDGKTILIVEDDLISAEYLKEIFANYSIRILFAYSGEEALEICQEDASIDLILMDIRLPGRNGYVTTEEIKKINKKIFIIAQTAYALQGDMEKALQAGCDDYISKPINASRLIEMVENRL